MEHAGLIEVGLIFGLVIALCLWELWSLHRDRRASRREQSGRPARNAPARPDVPTPPALQPHKPREVSCPTPTQARRPATRAPNA